MGKFNMNGRAQSKVTLIASALILLFAILAATIIFRMLDAILNLLILFVLLIRIKTDIEKRKQGRVYIYSGIAGIIITSVFVKVPFLWRITEAVLFSWAIAQLHLKLEKKKLLS